ncbi:DUF2252 family protein, partial [Streptomyces sp. NPDC059762]|uniref:DUF2252 family protein n=1 Tax=Streptomyces sp. NPDC059762 TaxID=3346938 RepID=UPI00364D8900
MDEIQAVVPGQRGETGGERIPHVPGFARRGGTTEHSPRALGKQLRTTVPRSSHARLTLPAGRPDAVRAVEESSRGRVPELTPIRVGRMAANPFAFLRGAAGLMAHDLVGTPVTRLPGPRCGAAPAPHKAPDGEARAPPR